jgi:hypothetical protein
MGLRSHKSRAASKCWTRCLVGNSNGNCRCCAIFSGGFIVVSCQKSSKFNLPNSSAHG